MLLHAGFLHREHDGVLVMKNAEMKRLRNSLARAEEDAAEQIDKLQVCSEPAARFTDFARSQQVAETLLDLYTSGSNSSLAYAMGKAVLYGMCALRSHRVH
jgi:hypothetical protein